MFLTLIKIRNVTWAPNPEGSCDTEDWSNGCWKLNFAIMRINNIQIYSNGKQLF